MIGKEVYIEVDKNSYSYNSDQEWVRGYVVGAFPSEDLLVEYSDDKRKRVPVDDIAFTEVIDLVATDPDKHTGAVKSAPPNKSIDTRKD